MSRCFRWQLFAVIAMASPFTLLADEGDTKVEPKKSTVSKAPAAAEPIDLFQAIDEDLVAVDFIPKDATEANVIFRNKSEKPVTIKLPETFAAVPVLGQLGAMGMGGGGMGMGGMGGGGMGMGGMGGGGMGMGGMGGGMQGMGGGMGGMGMGGMGGGGMGMGGMGGGGMGMGGMGMGGGMFELQPDKARKVKVVTVCLEHGKKDPNPRVKYKMVRLEEFSGDKKVAEVCKALGYGQIQQNTAQAAAWHFANGLSWQEMASKPRVVSQYTGVQMWFSQFELQNAMQFSQKVEKAIQSDKYTSGESRSESESIK